MAYTRHGYHIEGTSLKEEAPLKRVRCGGPEICRVCKVDAQEAIDVENEPPVDHPNLPAGNPMNYRPSEDESEFDIAAEFKFVPGENNHTRLAHNKAGCTWSIAVLLGTLHGVIQAAKQHLKDGCGMSHSFLTKSGTVIRHNGDFSDKIKIVTPFSSEETVMPFQDIKELFAKYLTQVPLRELEEFVYATMGTLIERKTEEEDEGA